MQAQPDSSVLNTDNLESQKKDLIINQSKSLLTVRSDSTDIGEQVIHVDLMVASSSMTPSLNTIATISNTPQLSLVTASNSCQFSNVSKIESQDFKSTSDVGLKRKKDACSSEIHNSPSPKIPSESPDTSILKCEECEYSTSNKHYLKQHKDLVHTEERPFKCPFCDYAGKRSHSLKEHLVVHSNERPYGCHLCNATFRKKGHLTNHIKMHSPQNESKIPGNSDNIAANTNKTDQIFLCKLCGFNSSDEQVVVKHLITHTQSDASKTVCVNSEKPKSVILSPEISKPPVVLMKCTECGFTSTDKDLLKKHMWIHIGNQSTENPQKPLKTDIGKSSGTAFKCGECLHETTEAYKFIAHMLTHKSVSPSEKSTLKASFTVNPLPNDDAKTQPKTNVVSSPQPDTPGFTQDSATRHFTCNICGYTCDHQRTIKAHAWKHLGHKDIDYPMFKNGPVSVYDDFDTDSNETKPNTNIISVGKVEKIQSSLGPGVSLGLKDSVTTPVFKLLQVKTPNNQTSSEMASSVPLALFSNVSENVVEVQTAVIDSVKDVKKANATQHIACAEIGQTRSGVKHSFKTIHLDDSSIKTLFPEKSLSTVLPKDAQISASDKTLNAPSCNPQKRSLNELHKMEGLPSVNTDDNTSSCKKLCTGNLSSSPNVVVEQVLGVSQSSVYTGLSSQKDRIVEIDDQPMASLSPSEDTGRDDLNNGIKNLSSETTEDRVGAVQNNSTAIQSVSKQELRKLLENDNSFTMVHVSTPLPKVNRPTEVVSLHGESALTLLSLLQKGESSDSTKEHQTKAVCLGNDAHMADPVLEVREEQVVSMEESQIENSDQNDIEDEDQDEANKPKAGICSSLLAVIEQLRERSKSESETDDLSQNNISGKRKPRKRNNKSPTHAFSQIEAMENVERLEDLDLKYRCKLCHYSNTSPTLMKQHMRLHKTKKPFECSLCDFVAESSEPLQDHMIQHCKMRSYQCKLCPSAFNYKSQLRAHMRAHSEKDPFLCDSCDFETTNPIKFRLHTRMHMDASLFRCELCQRGFNSQSQLNTHSSVGCNKSYYCEECMFTMTSEEEFKEHEKKHKKRILHCPVCDLVCTSQTSLRLHARTHEDSQEMKCDLCSFIAASSRSLKSHMKRHINDQRYVQQPLEQYKCNLCGYVCHHLPSLKSHMWRHASDKNYIYELTNEVINAAIDYDSRQDSSVEATKAVSNIGSAESVDHSSAGESDSQSDHPAVDLNTRKKKPTSIPCLITFRCCQCGFETISKYDLNQHMKVHSDIIQKTLEVSQSLSQSRLASKRLVMESIFDTSQKNKTVPV